MVNMGVHVDNNLIKNRKHVVNVLTLEQQCTFPQIQSWMQALLFCLEICFDSADALGEKFSFYALLEERFCHGLAFLTYHGFTNNCKIYQCILLCTNLNCIVPLFPVLNPPLEKKSENSS